MSTDLAGTYRYSDIVPTPRRAASLGIEHAASPFASAISIALSRIRATDIERRGPAMLVLIVASFMDLMDAMFTNVALPSIQRDLAATSAKLERTLSAYVLMLAVLLTAGGRLGDIAGRRTIFLADVGGFTLSSLGASLSATGGELVLARGLQGTFAALMVPQVLATAHAVYEHHEHGKIFGLMSALGGLGGQLLGGWMVTADAFGIGWRSAFVINVPVGAVIFVLAPLLVPDTLAARGATAVPANEPKVTGSMVSPAFSGVKCRASWE